jgi:hypothetical protein
MEGRVSRAADVYSFGESSDGVAVLGSGSLASIGFCGSKAATNPSPNRWSQPPTNRTTPPPHPQTHTGVVVWEMFQGHRPYPGLTHSQILHALSSGKTLAVPAGAPADVRPLLARCLDARAEGRWGAGAVWEVRVRGRVVGVGGGCLCLSGPIVAAACRNRLPWPTPILKSPSTPPKGPSFPRLCSSWSGWRRASPGRAVFSLAALESFLELFGLARLWRRDLGIAVGVPPPFASLFAALGCRPSVPRTDGGARRGPRPSYLRPFFACSGALTEVSLAALAFSSQGAAPPTCL